MFRNLYDEHIGQTVHVLQTFFLLSRSNINKYPLLQAKTVMMGQQSFAQYSSSEQGTLSSVSVEKDKDEWGDSFVWFTGSSPAGMQVSAFTMTNSSQHGHEDNQKLCLPLILLPRIAEFSSLWPQQTSFQRLCMNAHRL